KYGRLLVLSKAPPKVSKSGKRSGRWNCKCDCGGSAIPHTYSLTSGNTKSCGCLQKDRTSSASIKLGLSNSRIYFIWNNMKRRCNDSNSPQYQDYGGRGISYTPEWEHFHNFYKDMGEGYTDELMLDREDNNKGYSKDNCRWV